MLHMGFGHILWDGGKVANAPDQFGPQFGFHHRKEAQEGGFSIRGEVQEYFFHGCFLQ